MPPIRKAIHIALPAAEDRENAGADHAADADRHGGRHADLAGAGVGIRCVGRRSGRHDSESSSGFARRLALLSFFQSPANARHRPYCLRRRDRLHSISLSLNKERGDGAPYTTMPPPRCHDEAIDRAGEIAALAGTHGDAKRSPARAGGTEEKESLHA
jgi:hypothetical protein